MTGTDFHLVLFGATSFVGQILARYLLEAAPAEPGLRWAAAGRSREKLENLRSALGPAAENLPLIVADAGDEAALRRLCARTRVVVSTVGPYELYGDTLVQVCAERGTDYCDVTGEVRWMRRMIATYEETARRSGARLVPACGFDSLPSDMGVWFLQQQARQHLQRCCRRVRMRVIAARGGFSGGTVATLLNEAAALNADPALRRLLADPYALCPDGYSNPTRQHRVTAPEYDDALGKWVMPFVMAPVNEAVVFRSHALLGHPYGEDFRYEEAAATGRGLGGRLRAAAGTAMGKAFLGAVSTRSLRRLLQHYVLPSPGEGPGPAARRAGFFNLRFCGWTDTGQCLQTRVTGDRDPGYGATARMLGQCAISLARDVPADKPGGFWTPATLFDERLIERLRQRAGMGFDLVSAG